MCVPARSWKTMPEVMMGVMPNSINVPRLLAIILTMVLLFINPIVKNAYILSQYIGSALSEDTIP